ncbi:DUF6265 family protein [Dyadobacter psychrotolerans]|uniref:DUF6265 domain-containing protein n=1 Tax=Dyadobacter psychrotolerans TaxID=2541721 RepID=A0A4R5DK68_9BACT|nr:DUF6265 family protein [Dyadobacter psychrotolerans]TDE14409.1 hypothetical protein E0F88_14505 [Dyadobacter psychrotolerans]
MKSLFSVLFLAFSFAGAAIGQTTVPKAGVISDLNFTEGQWIATPEGRSIEASWLRGQKDNLTGFFRIITAGKPNLYELLVYEQTEKGTVSLVKHFSPGLIGQEPLDKPVRHVCLESKAGRVLYEKDGEPVRILYEKKTNDQFVISVGKPENGSWVYKPLFDFKRIK